MKQQHKSGSIWTQQNLKYTELYVSNMLPKKILLSLNKMGYVESDLQEILIQYERRVLDEPNKLKI